MAWWAIAVIFFSPSAARAENFLHTYRENQAELDTFASLKHDTYERIGHSVPAPPGTRVYELQYPNEITDDSNLGFRMRPSTQVRHISRTDREILYDAIYSFDRFGRRLADLSHPERRKRFLILYGCSVTYGNGLNDNETLNYFLGKALPEYHPYNYAIGATGANTMLALVSEGKFHDQIPQKEGVFVYVSLGYDHVGRTAGLWPSISWLKTSPYYEIKRGKPERHGSFLTGRPLVTGLYLQLGNLLSFLGFGNHIFPPVTGRDIDYTCALVTATKENFVRQYPGSRFIYYLHPLATQRRELDECLEKNGVELHKGVFTASPEELTIKIDHHPNAKANQIVAAELAQIVRKQPTNSP